MYPEATIIRTDPLAKVYQESTQLNTLKKKFCPQIKVHIDS